MSKATLKDLASAISLQLKMRGEGYKIPENAAEIVSKRLSDQGIYDARKARKSLLIKEFEMLLRRPTLWRGEIA